MKLKKKLLVILPSITIVSGLVAASAVSNYLLLNVNKEWKNVSVTGRGLEADPQNPNVAPEQFNNEWIDLGYDRFNKIINPIWDSNDRWNNFGLITDWGQTISNYLGDECNVGKYSLQLPGIANDNFYRIGDYRSGPRLDRMVANNNTNNSLYVGVHWNTYQSTTGINPTGGTAHGNAIKVKYPWKAPLTVFNKADRSWQFGEDWPRIQIGGSFDDGHARQSYKCVAGADVGWRTPAAFTTGSFNYNQNSNSISSAFTRTLDLSDPWPYNDTYTNIQNPYGVAHGSSKFGEIWFSDPYKGYTNEESDTLYVGRKGGDGYFASSSAAYQNTYPDRWQPDGNPFPDYYSVGLDRPNTNDLIFDSDAWPSKDTLTSYWGHPMFRLWAYGPNSDWRGYEHYFQFNAADILTPYSEYCWRWPNTFNSHNYLIQMLWGYNSYYSTTIQPFSPRFNANVTPRYNATKKANDRLSRIYPSQFLDNIDSIGKMVDVNYNTWPALYFLSNVKLKYNDDLGQLKLRITPGPGFEELTSFRATDRPHTSMSGVTFRFAGYATTPSNPIELTFSGFKANNTSWNQTTIQYENGSKIVASKNFDLNLLKQNMWEQMTRGITHNSLGWHSDGNDKFITNWDRIKGFDMDSISLWKGDSYRVNIREGTITVDACLYKSIINGQHSDSANLSTALTFTGFYKITSRSSVRTPYMDLFYVTKKTNDFIPYLSLDAYKNLNHDQQNNKIKDLILRYERDYTLTDKSLFKNLDYALLSNQESNFRVLDSVIDYSNGTVDVLCQTDRIYDPDRDLSGPINEPLKFKLKLAGFYSTKYSPIPNMNPTIVTMANKTLFQTITSALSPGPFYSPGLSGLNFKVLNTEITKDVAENGIPASGNILNKTVDDLIADPLLLNDFLIQNFYTIFEGYYKVQDANNSTPITTGDFNVVDVASTPRSPTTALVTVLLPHATQNNTQTPQSFTFDITNLRPSAKQKEVNASRSNLYDSNLNITSVKSSSPRYIVENGIPADSNLSKLGPTTNTSYVNSAYFNPLIQEYASLYFDPFTNVLRFNTFGDKAFVPINESEANLKSILSRGYDFQSFNSQEHNLPIELSMDMRMVPLSSNASGLSNAYIIFPSGPLGLNSDKDKSKYIYLVELEKRSLNIKPIGGLSADVFANKPIISVGGSFFRGNQYKIIFTLFNPKSKEFEVYGSNISSNRYSANAEQIGSSTSKLITKFNVTNTDFSKNLAGDWSNQNMLPKYVDSATNEAYLYNSFHNPLMPVVYDQAQNIYSTAFVSSIPNKESFNKRAKFDMNFNLVGSLSGGLITLNKPTTSNAEQLPPHLRYTNLPHRMYYTRNQKYLIINVKSNKNGDSTISALIHEIGTDTTYEVKLGNVANNEEIALIPDQNNELGNYVVKADAKKVTSVQQVYTDVNVSATTNRSIYDLYNEYLQVQPGSTNYNNYTQSLIREFIYDPANGVNNLRYLPIDTADIRKINIKGDYDQVFFDFKTNEFYFTIRISDSLSSDLSVFSNAILFRIKTNDQVASVTTVEPVEQKWQNINADATSINAELDAVNALTGDAFQNKVKEYLTLGGKVVSGKTKFVEGSFKLVSVGSNVAKVAITVDQALDQKANQLVMTDNKVFEVAVRVNPVKPALPQDVGIVSLQTGPNSEGEMLKSFVNKSAGDFVNAIDSNFNTKLIEDIKYAIVQKMLESTNYKDLKPDDIALGTLWQFNNSTGEAWVDVSVPKFSDPTLVPEGETDPYLQKRVSFVGFKKFPATNIIYANDQTNQSIRANILPSELQTYFDENPFNIYNLIAASQDSVYKNEATDKLKMYFWPYAIDDGGNVKANPNKIPEDQYEQLDALIANNTTVTGQVISFDDDQGTAKVRLIIKNGYSADDNVYIQENGAPLPETTITKELDFVDLKSNSNSAYKTSVLPEFNISGTPADLITSMTASDLTKPKNKALIYDQLVKNNAIIERPSSVNADNIQYVSLEPNNKEGTLSVTMHLPSLIDKQGQTVNAPDNVNFKTVIKGFKKITAGTTINLTNQPTNIDLSTLSETLFDPTGKFLNNQNANRIFDSLVSVQNAPLDYKEEMYGRVVDINITAGTAKIEFRLASYYANDSIYSEVDNLEFIVDVVSNTHGAVFARDLRIKQGQDSSTNTQLIRSSYFTNLERKSWILTAISLTSSISLLLVLFVIAGYIYYNHHKKNNKTK